MTNLTFFPLNCTSRSPDLSPDEWAWLSKSTDRTKTGLFPLKVTPKPPSARLLRVNFLMRDMTTKLGGTLWDCRASWITWKWKIIGGHSNNYLDTLWLIRKIISRSRGGARGGGGGGFNPDWRVASYLFLAFWGRGVLRICLWVERYSHNLEECLSMIWLPDWQSPLPASMSSIMWHLKVQYPADTCIM